VHLVINIHILLVHVPIVKVVSKWITLIHLVEQYIGVLHAQMTWVRCVSTATSLVFEFSAVNGVEAHHFVVVVAEGHLLLLKGSLVELLELPSTC
jgi:uncharacterized protein involved in cysteine biosynthesis